ncbi:Serine/threonine-protein kinase, partial [Kappamyces sp. JEL0680]
MDEFKNLTEIGRGSFATVFKAVTTAKAFGSDTGESNVVVAIKTVNRSKLNRKLAENLEMEINILKKSRHRNVVLLYKVLKSDTEIHMIMEYCNLGDLSLFIKKKGHVPGLNPTLVLAGPWGGLEEFVLRYLLAQLSSAIEFLRFHQIVHRDLKPQNILLTLPPPSAQETAGTLTQQKLALLPILKLGDFGFARALEAETMASTLCGSPILRGEKYDAKTDLWSIGAILFEMMTGRPPFRAQNHIELLRKIERGDGWIRFPDESPDEHSQLTREYHVGSQRQTGIVQRKSLATIVSGYGSTARVGSLGASPGATFKSKIPIPDDLKGLTRRLLKRNPIERMGFEEFFIHPTVVDCRKMDPQLMEPPAVFASPSREEPLFSPLAASSSRSSSSSQAQLSPQRSDTVAPLVLQDAMEGEAPVLPAPFPSYGHDPNWSQKVLNKIDSIKPNSPLPSLKTTP